MGLATEAASAALKYGFEIAKLAKIVAITKSENIASRRVMEKVGMKYEKDAYHYDNHVVYYSMMREAYQSNAIARYHTGIPVVPIFCVLEHAPETKHGETPQAQSLPLLTT